MDVCLFDCLESICQYILYVSHIYVYIHRGNIWRNILNICLYQYISWSFYTNIFISFRPGIAWNNGGFSSAPRPNISWLREWGFQVDQFFVSVGISRFKTIGFTKDLQLTSHQGTVIFIVLDFQGLRKFLRIWSFSALFHLANVLAWGSVK